MYNQIVGILKGTNCAPLVADLFLFCFIFDKNIDNHGKSDISH